MRDDDFLNFKSAIEWPHMRPPREEAAADLMPLSRAFYSALETSAYAATIAPDCESEIEIDLGAKLLRVFAVIGDPTIRLQPQYILGRYRYDFAILREGRSKPILLIECDGKAFHETPEQIRNDAAKNQLAAKEGIRIERFSGAQIFRDIGRCVYKVVKALRLSANLTQQQWDVFEGDCASRRFVL